MTAPNPASCHPRRRSYARGLCSACYTVHHRRGTLDQHPRVKRTCEDFAEDYGQLRSWGLSRAQVAERLGVTRNAVDLAYGKAVRRGLLTPDRRST